MFHTPSFARIRAFDWVLFIAVCILMSLGLAAMYSIGLGKDSQDFTFLQKQLTILGIGIIPFIAISAFNYRKLANYSTFVYIASMVVLAAVLIFGDTIRGTRGWFHLMGFSFQPSEIAKIALVLILAWYFNKYTRQLGQFRHIIVSSVLAAIPVGLVALQPDFGTAAILFTVWLGMILISGIPKRYLVSIGIILLIGTTCAWLFLFKDYQKDRILAFVKPSSDQLGRSYNVRQAIIAIGSGGIWGQGIGSGSQSHLKFLPENQTDFIFAVVAEEMGLVGVTILFLCFTTIFFRLYIGIRRARDDFALFVLLGCTILLITQVTINIGGNLGLVPVTGIVLPFVSYGGSALLANLLLIGVVQSVISHTT